MTLTAEIKAIHNALCAAIIEHVSGTDICASVIAEYLEQSAKGMRVNAAFCLKGDALAETLEQTELLK